MTFIFIMSTIGRTEELVQFFESVTSQKQTFPIKIYLCDQNDDERLSSVLQSWHDRLSIRVVRSERGLSRGRNAALAVALADIGLGRRYIVAFPDDDCWYSNDVLKKVSEIFNNEPNLSGVTGRSMSAESVPSAISSPHQRANLDRSNILWASVAISYCIFLRLDVVQSVGMFDETLGVGSGTPWGSGEESDYLLRALRKNARLRYEPDIEIFHPNKNVVLDGKRYLAYACGHGRVLRLNGYSWGILIRDIGIAVMAFFVKSIFKGRIMYPYLFRAWGYLQGYVARVPRSELTTARSPTS